MKRCSCCGFESDNYRLFVRYNPPGHRPDSDQWMCRSETKCRERTGT